MDNKEYFASLGYPLDVIRMYIGELGVCPECGQTLCLYTSMKGKVGICRSKVESDTILYDKNGGAHPVINYGVGCGFTRKYLSVTLEG